MNTYLVRVEERSGHAYNAEVKATHVYIEDGLLVFSLNNAKIAAFTNWVYFKKIVSEE